MYRDVRAPARRPEAQENEPGQVAGSPHSARETSVNSRLMSQIMISAEQRGLKWTRKGKAGSLLVGGVAASVVLLLLAPKSGAALRSDLVGRGEG